MPLTIFTDPSVFRVEDHDAIRIGKTRVSLDTLVTVFNSGQTSEQILQGFPTLQLADVYTAIGYYLRHRAEVDAYIAEGERKFDEFCRDHPETSANGLREKLLARREAINSG